MEKDLNKVLSEIYVDLENLQTAREQVENITESGKELIAITSNLIKELKDFANKVGNENTSNITQLNKSLVVFENKISSLSEKGIQSFENYISTFKNQTSSIIENFTKQIQNNEKSLSEINKLSYERIWSTIEEFEKSINNLKKQSEIKIEELKSDAIDKIQIQEQIIAKTIESISDTNSKNKELILTIKNYDIPKYLETIDQKLTAQAKQNDQIKKLLIVSLSLLGLVVIISIGIYAK
jgi:hypothetical protein